MNYSAKVVRVLEGGVSIVAITGPKLPKYANEIMVPGEWESGTIERFVAFLNLAFEAGREDKAAEIRRAIGAC